MLALELKDFMSIESARLEFDETGILNLVGYNDSGKSAVTRSLEILFYDAYSGTQINFIRDDQDYFGVGVEFDDGISINKYKYANGKSVWEMLKNDEIIFTNQLADGIAAMGDVPEPIAKYLGVVKDDSTDEQLNVRRSANKLFLIDTSGGDNYKIINSVLRYDILAESVKRMNEDRNKLQSEVANLATSSKTLKGELDSITVLDYTTLGIISEKTKNLKVNRHQVEYLMAIRDQKQILDEFTVHDEISLADTSRLTAITALQELKEATEIPIFDECKLIDNSRLDLLISIMQLRSSLDVVIPPECPIVDAQQLKDMQRVGEKFNDVWTITNDLATVESEYVTVSTQLVQLSQQHGFKICKNCGTVAV
jgi:energy-coupling factor transporter ATP-binding protein EcfA2